MRSTLVSRVELGSLYVLGIIGTAQSLLKINLKKFKK